MGDAAFRTGWRVVRVRYRAVVSPARRRTRFRVGLVVAVVVGVSGTVALLLWPDSGRPLPVALAGVASVAAAAGCLGASCCRVAPRRTDWSVGRSGDRRRDDRVARQFAPYPPAVLPEDRDTVLERAAARSDGLVAGASRTVLFPAVWLFAWIGTLLIGSGDRTVLLVFSGPAAVLLQSSAFVTVVTALGRAEAARGRAEAMPPSPPRSSARRRGRGPVGTKLGLPD